MSDVAGSEGRRDFFKTVGRGLVLGLTGVGTYAMIKNGRVEVCIQQHLPCNTCLNLKKGCELPKAEAHRKETPRGRS